MERIPKQSSSKPRTSSTTSNVRDHHFCCRLVSLLICVTGNQLRQSLRQWVAPPDPSTNHNIARDIHQTGTAEWFFQGSIFGEWMSEEGLLWIYGKRMLFACVPDRPLIAVCFLSRSWKEHPLVRPSSSSTYA